MRKIWLSLFGALLLAFANPAFADETSAANDVSATEDVEKDVQNEANKQAAERRNAILKEAVDALAQTKVALKALDEERIDEALDALAMTTGKLELIVARDPGLALAPTDMTVTTHDLFATPETIEDAIERSEEAIEDGNIQEARRILDALGSELIITVFNLPLATYPDAIKAITPLIDAGEIEQAKRGLEAALNTLVVRDHVIPLPVMRSEALIDRAEELAKNDERSDAENEELRGNLAEARKQLEMAQLLGYGDRKDYKPLYAQLDAIGEDLEDGQNTEGYFEKMRSSMSDLWDSIFS
jgi:hypothetical protein